MATWVGGYKLECPAWIASVIVAAGKRDLCCNVAHLAGLVCLGIKHTVTKPQAGLLSNLLQVGPHAL